MQTGIVERINRAQPMRVICRTEAMMAEAVEYMESCELIASDVEPPEIDHSDDDDRASNPLAEISDRISFISFDLILNVTASLAFAGLA